LTEKLDALDIFLVIIIDCAMPTKAITIASKNNCSATNKWSSENDNNEKDGERFI